MSSPNENWLEDVIVINESRDRSAAGDISVFRNGGDACGYLEPWWVKDKEGVAINGIGLHVVLGMRDNSVVIDRYEKITDGPQTLHHRLRAEAEDR